MSGEKLTRCIREANAAGRKALIPFLPGGYPDEKRFWDELASLDACGADIIEIGVPFSDPVADGPVVEQASLECVERGVTLAWILQGLKERKGQFRAALVLMGYMNPFYQYGLSRLAEDMELAGVSGLIAPDVPLEESQPLRRALEAKGLALVNLIGLNTSKERMLEYAQVSSGFVYVVSVLGTTGERDALPAEVLRKLQEARESFTQPLALGFGIKSPDQLAAFGDLVDAVVFGSALIRHIRDGGDAAGFMARWR